MADPDQFLGMRYLCLCRRKADREEAYFPELSPHKSLEGCIGGVVGAALIGGLYAHFLWRRHSRTGQLHGSLPLSAPQVQ